MAHSFSIVGCEKGLQEHLQHLLLNFENFRCNGIANSKDEALDNILKNPPSIIFLDVDKKNGIKDPFNFVNELHQYLEELPAFVALSSSKTYSYEAIKNSFQDYLIKPVNLLDLRKCVMKFQKVKLHFEEQKICIKSYSDYRFININEILFLKADNNTTDFYLSKGHVVTAYKSLKYFEEKLNCQFVRVHHSYVINSRKIVRINFGKSQITLGAEAPPIPFSRSYKPQVDQMKEKFSSSLSLVS